MMHKQEVCMSKQQPGIMNSRPLKSKHKCKDIRTSRRVTYHKTWRWLTNECTTAEKWFDRKFGKWPNQPNAHYKIKREKKHFWSTPPTGSFADPVNVCWSVYPILYQSFWKIMISLPNLFDIATFESTTVVSSSFAIPVVSSCRNKFMNRRYRHILTYPWSNLTQHNTTDGAYVSKPEKLGYYDVQHGNDVHGF